jgi:hypothetical protein
MPSDEVRQSSSGYSAGRPLAEVWEVQLMGPECAAPRQIQAEQELGPLWDGEYEALDRLIFGLGTKFTRRGRGEAPPRRRSTMSEPR